MNNFIYKLNNFFKGRYGIDDLYKALFCLYLTLFTINIFLSSYIIKIFEFVLIFIMLYRLLSKNIKNRKRENDLYLDIKLRLKKKIRIIKTIFKERNTSMYKRCPKCRQLIRLPLKKGKHKVKCPKCQHEFYVKCRRNEKVKVEIVK